MNQDRANKILIITTTISIVVLMLGTTFSYFSVSTKSRENALSVKAENIRLMLGVSSLTANKLLIPTRDKDINIALKQNCVDDFGFGACSAYSFELFNFNKTQDVIGTIDFTVKDIDNLRYMVLDENGNIYQDKTNIPDGNTINLPLGQHFIIEDGTEEKPASKKFTLVIWLSNIEDEDQSSYDAGGTFEAKVKYTSVSGLELTGTIDGMENDTETTSQVGGGL